MNYRHSYHTGNIGDVLKHVTLVAIIKSLLRKDTAFCVHDTHAGIGYYDLQSESTQKSKEYERGILKVWQQENPPPLIQEYLKCVRKLNPDESLHSYPGSPYIARQLLRPQDRMVLTELHPEDFSLLKQTFPHDKQVGIHHLDAYQGLKAFLPPKERRGLVLMDPAYEVADELTHATDALAAAVERWETGIFALWYPIKEIRALQSFYRELPQKISRPMLLCELSTFPENIPSHLNGSGMLIVNPPWQLDEELKNTLPWLWQTLSQDGLGRYEVKSL